MTLLDPLTDLPRPTIAGKVFHLPLHGNLEENGIEALSFENSPMNPFRMF